MTGLDPTPKRLVLCAWLISFGFLLPPAATAAETTKTTTEKPRYWSLDAAVHGEYDDNILTASTGETESWKAILEPTLQLNMPTEETAVGFRYGYRLTAYEQDITDDRDDDHHLDVWLSHQLPHKLTVSINERLRYGAEPELVELAAGIPVVLRRRGDFLFSDLDANLTHPISDRVAILAGGLFRVWNFTSNPAQTNDRYRVGGQISGRYQLDTQTTSGLGYRFAATTYDMAGPQHQRNSDAHLIYGLIERNLGESWTARLKGGLEWQQFENGDRDSAPFADGGLAYSYAAGSALAIGLHHSITASENTNYRSAKATVVYGQADHQFTEKISATIRAFYAVNKLDNSTASLLPSNVDEDSISLSLLTRYAVTPWFTAEAAYRHDHVASDLEGADLTRNRFSVGGRVNY